MTYRQTNLARAALQRRALLRLFLVGFVSILASSCQKPFDVNVKAEEPINVNLSMDVHVYQHGGSLVKKPKALEEGDSEAKEYKAILERRRNRMSDIQTLKNDRIIGENHAGLLSIKVTEKDAGNWPMDFVRKTIKEENEDRSYLIRFEAERRNVNIFEVQREQWMHQLRKSHPGEWIEIADPDRPGVYVWVQKKTPIKAPDQIEE
ncbi:MAG: DUF1318 domain-containing protein [Verrucomicrobiales bacterium]|nr:DUF1318 domain-containing protein [Verrucomicrobiales bacterium]